MVSFKSVQVCYSSPSLVAGSVYLLYVISMCKKMQTCTYKLILTQVSCKESGPTSNKCKWIFASLRSEAKGHVQTFPHGVNTNHNVWHQNLILSVPWASHLPLSLCVIDMKWLKKKRGPRGKKAEYGVKGMKRRAKRWGTKSVRKDECRGT